MKHPYFMPAEWEKHRGTLLGWPSNVDTWEGLLEEVGKSHSFLMARLSEVESVYLSLKPDDDRKKIASLISSFEGNLKRVHFLDIPNNDAWLRDSGPNYVFSKDRKEIAINDWGYNAWGEKYPPWDEDEKLTTRFAEWIGYQKLFRPGMILEGGSIDVNGKGILLTTKSCLLNKNRNPKLNQAEIEDRLKKYLGIQKIIWLNFNPALDLVGIAGDDTDGHVDDFARFVSEDTIVCSFEENKKDENYMPLSEAYEQLCVETDLEGNLFKVVKLPMPAPKYFQGFRIPASYANFYFANGCILLPTFKDPMDKVAVRILSKLRPDLKIVEVPSLDFVRGLGGIHCLTQQIY